MTLEELENRTDVVRGFGYNCYVVKITYRGKQYVCQSNNSLAWDRIQSEENSVRAIFCSYSLKEAYQAFYNECKRKNNLR